MEREILSLFLAGPKSRLEAARFVQKGVHIRGRNCPGNNRTRSFREKGSFSCRHICFGKQLLLQINICCRKVMQNNKMTSSMGQPLLDACSILEKRLPGSRAGFEF